MNPLAMTNGTKAYVEAAAMWTEEEKQAERDLLRAWLAASNAGNAYASAVIDDYARSGRTIREITNGVFPKAD